MTNLHSVSCNHNVPIYRTLSKQIDYIHILDKRIYSRGFIWQNKGNLGKRLGNYRIPKMKDLTTNISVR